MLMKTPQDIFENACIYIFIIFCGIPATILYNMTSGIIRSLGDSKTPVVFLALSSCINIVLDVVLIYYVKMGVAGAAVATVAGQIVGGIIGLTYNIKKNDDITQRVYSAPSADSRVLSDTYGTGNPHHQNTSHL